MYRLSVIAVIASILFSCTTQNKDSVNAYPYTNDLIDESSPYLLQHAHNPVNWMPWNDTTLNLAQSQKKLMIVSIGYAACHWCHVMEHESFEDTIVAAAMNANYISVKVDREERPDVDQVYINAVQLMTGRAGWPLNVITLPDGRPVWGGTYVPKENWIQTIEQVQKIYEQDPQKLIDYATQLEEGIKSMDLVTLNTKEIDFSNYRTNPILEKWAQSFDGRYGGHKRSPKFMMPNNVAYWLRAAETSLDAELLNHVTLTLDQMAYGGVYDHIGGGFARYSTDEKWHIPHFEKMLYDNAQLVSLYSDAYLVTKKPLYKEVVEETLNYIATEMTTNEGSFYSSLDADSKAANGELQEGAYYTYTEEELQSLLKDDLALFKVYYNINSFGKWEEEDVYVLIRDQSDENISEAFNISLEELGKKKRYWKQILLDFRNLRPRPRLDDKTLTSWNALMLKGYVDAYKAFGKQEYLEAALKNGDFLATRQMESSGRLFHNYKNQQSSINGYLEDYAAVIQAFISLYEVTLDDKWIGKARELTEYTFVHFFDTEKSMFYFTSNEDSDLISRNFEYRDNVIPASNSIMAKNLLVLSHHFDDKKYAQTAKQMLKNVLPELEQYPSGFSNWLDLLANYQSNYYEVVVVGAHALKQVQQINKKYIPGKLIAGSTANSNNPLLKGRFVDNNTFIYICVNNTCKLPVTSVEKALELIK